LALFFFKHFITVIPKIEKEEIVFISDCNKGFKAIDNELEDYVIRAICAYYLIDNFTT
jgi:hypothetical protein